MLSQLPHFEILYFHLYPYAVLFVFAIALLILDDDRIIQKLETHMLDYVMSEILIDKYDFINNEEDLKIFIDMQ